MITGASLVPWTWTSFCSCKLQFYVFTPKFFKPLNYTQLQVTICSVILKQHGASLQSISGLCVSSSFYGDKRLLKKSYWFISKLITQQPHTLVFILKHSQHLIVLIYIHLFPLFIELLILRLLISLITYSCI